MLTRTCRKKSDKVAIPTFEVVLDSSKRSICSNEHNGDDTDDTEPKPYYIASNRQISTKNLVNYHIKTNLKDLIKGNCPTQIANKVNDLSEAYFSTKFKVLKVHKTRLFPCKSKRSTSVDSKFELSVKK
jgi:hypothetical protein